mgnify:CR=1 FL=1
MVGNRLAGALFGDDADTINLAFPKVTRCAEGDFLKAWKKRRRGKKKCKTLCICEAKRSDTAQLTTDVLGALLILLTVLLCASQKGFRGSV